MDHGFVTCCCGLMQRGGVGVSSGRVVPVGIFSRVEQRTDYVDVTELRGYCEGEVTVFRDRRFQKMLELGVFAESGGNGEIQFCAVPEQRSDGVVFVKDGGWADGGAGVCSVLAEQIDEWDLHLAFTRNAAGRY